MAILQAKTITQLMGEGFSLAFGTATLDGSVTLSVTTGLKNVKFSAVTINKYPTTTTGDTPQSEIQTSGKLHLTTIGATGSTLVNWFAIGESAR